MKVAVVGSRNFVNYELLSDKLKFLTGTDTIVSGGAKGADSLAARYAAENDVNLKMFPAEWEKYGRSAGYKRNVQIVDESDSVIAFWDGKSKGTEHSINIAKKQRKHVLIHFI